MIPLLEKFNFPKYLQVIKFHVLNFRCIDYLQKFFNGEFLPIYGNMHGIYNTYKHHLTAYFITLTTLSIQHKHLP